MQEYRRSREDYIATLVEKYVENTVYIVPKKNMKEAIYIE
jgi:hypothetical protein